MIVRMIEISIPRFGIGKPPSGRLLIRRIVSDYTGTLSCGGKLTPGVAERLRKLKALVDIDVVSSDSFGTAHDELRVIPLEPHILRTNEHDEEKRLSSARMNRKQSQLSEMGETTL
jgi:soluble P-type ATPase